MVKRSSKHRSWTKVSRVVIENVSTIICSMGVFHVYTGNLSYVAQGNCKTSANQQHVSCTMKWHRSCIEMGVR